MKFATTTSLAACLLLSSLSGYSDASRLSESSSDTRSSRIGYATSLSSEDHEEELHVSFLFEEGFTKLFETWTETFRKRYITAEERFYRMMVWVENHVLIEKHNNKFPKPPFSMGHNAYSDLTQNEFHQMFNLGSFSPGIPESFASKGKLTSSEDDAVAAVSMLRRVERRTEEIDGESDDSEESEDLNDFEKKKSKKVDWRKKAVTAVKNQGHCGSCWAFSAVGAIEGLMAVNSYPLANLSVQELVDCDKSDMGCMGGLMDNAFLYDEGLPGLCSWEDYPYNSPHIDGQYKCNNTACKPVVGSKISGFRDVEHTDEDLAAAIKVQPISVAIEANTLSFQFYKKGVYDDTQCGDSLDHGVVAVGYGSEEGKKYYLIKNSWGVEWGDKGYIKLLRGEDAGDSGQCGILNMASYPVE